VGGSTNVVAGGVPVKSVAGLVWNRFSVRTAHRHLIHAQCSDSIWGRLCWELSREVTIQVRRRIDIRDAYEFMQQFWLVLGEDWAMGV